MPTPTSRIPGFYNLPLAERLKAVSQALGQPGVSLPALPAELADQMVENAVGTFALPLGLALNFVVNGREVIVPMAIEEPSVIAGASFMARLARDGGGFQAEADPPEMIGQAQILDVPDLDAAQQALVSAKPDLLAEATQVDPMLARLGGGARDLEVRRFDDTPAGPMLVIHLIYDVRDAMGANAVNTAVERLAPRFESLTGGRVHLRILSNLADRRLVRARCLIPEASLACEGYPGGRVRRGVFEAWAMAATDPYRAVTHNKGIMNGIDAVLLATGNDWRAAEAGAHAYAARSGRYTSLSTWSEGEDGSLVGMIELPLAVGIVGGATRAHPTARTCLEWMRVESAAQLAEIVASVGLAQNLAALRALATEGIQRGHMGLHARQVAIAAGATGECVERLARQLVSEGNVRLDRAQELLEAWRDDSPSSSSGGGKASARHA
jgi:hydroxymethylglutaryl-CoA reductase